MGDEPVQDKNMSNLQVHFHLNLCKLRTALEASPELSPMLPVPVIFFLTMMGTAKRRIHQN
jgi:hypothetical protein